MLLRLSYPTVRAAARRVLAKYGTEYNYRAPEHWDDRDAVVCRNINVAGEDGNRNGVGCIVGEIMKDLGVTIPVLGGVWATQNDLKFEGHPVTLTRMAFNFLAAAQNAQDAGGKWGDAFNKGVEVAHTPIY